MSNFVHNHGTEDGAGLACPEVVATDGQLAGACILDQGLADLASERELRESNFDELLSAMDVYASIDYDYPEPDAESVLIRGRVCCATCGAGTWAAPCPDHQPRELAALLRQK